MTNIAIDNVQRRISQVQELLSNIRPMTSGTRRPVAAFFVKRHLDTLVTIAAAERKTGDSHRDWLFRTSTREVWAQYAEEWEVQDSGEALLKAVALQLFLVIGPAVNQRAELCALHCEPRELGTTLSSHCKRSLHLHVTADQNRLSHAHFPLDIGAINVPLTSIDTLTHHYAEMLKVFELEVFTRIK